MSSLVVFPKSSLSSKMNFKVSRCLITPFLSLLISEFKGEDRTAFNYHDIELSLRYQPNILLFAIFLFSLESIFSCCSLSIAYTPI